MAKNFNNAKKTALTNADEKEVLDDVKPTMGDEPNDKDKGVSANNTATAGSSEYDPKRISGKGSVIKQEAIAKAISGNGAGSSGGIQPTILNSGLRSIQYSGTDARIIDNASGTPAFNKSDRSNSRYGQKTDNTARHINYVPSETYTLEYDGPKPLSESPDSVQGSLGHPANEYARIQKCSEAFPGAYNFERSIDELTDDVVIATNGQQIDYEQSGETYSSIDPTKTFDKDSASEVNYFIHRGNYIPRTMHATYDDSGNLIEYYYDEDDVSTHAVGDLVAERASTHTVTAANRAEIDRQAMAAKAGNEVQAEWSPIPFAYPEPTKDVLYLSTVEKQLGSNVFTAVKMSAKAHSYQLNKAAKDGMRPESSGAELALGTVYAKNNSKAYDRFTFGDRDDVNSVFNRTYTSEGAPSAIVAMMDSVAKYHDRSDLLTQPRSFNMILKQGLSNYKAFKIDPEFARVFDNINVFSTIDRAYDPSSVVCLTDTVGLMNAYSFNELGSCFRKAKIYSAYEDNFTNNMDGFIYDEDDVVFKQKDGSSVIKEFDLAGCLKVKLSSGNIGSYIPSEKDINKCISMIRKNAAGINGCNMFNRNYCVAIMKDEGPTNVDQKAILLFFDLDRNTDTSKATFTAVCGSVEDTFTLSHFDEDSFSGNTLIYNNYLAAKYNNRQNFYYVELRDPYTDGIKTFLRQNAGLMLKVTKNNKVTWPIHYSTKNFNAYSYLVMLSLRYMQEQRAKAMLDVLNYSNNFGYPFTDCEDTGNYNALGGSQYGQSDIFELLEVRQMSPATALRWTYPELYCNLESSSSTPSGYKRILMPFYFNEDAFDWSADGISLSFDRASMSYPVTKSGVRWSYSDLIYGFSERDARLIFDMMVIPPCFNGRDSYSGTCETYKYSQSSDGLLVATCEPITIAQHLRTPRELGYLFPVKGGYLFPEPDGTNNLTYRYPADAIINGHSSHRIICWVNNSGTPQDEILDDGSSIITRAANFTQQYFIFNVYEENAGLDIGICLSPNDSQIVQDNVTSFVPFTDGIAVAGSEGIMNNSPALFTYAKALWARIQKLPFALNPFEFGGNVITADPFSFNYLMGLVGFRASDYKEDLYNRITQRMSEGWKYVNDPFVESSLIVK